MAAKDIKSDDNEDLFIDPITGDFKIDFSDQQHIQDIIEASQGDYKEFPSLGVGIEAYLNSSGTEQTIERSVKLQLQSDGYSVSGASVTFDPNGKLIIEPKAIRP